MDAKLKATIWQQIQGLVTSPSHDLTHLERVLVFAGQLRTIYGGDPEVITAAAMLHDLGRADRELAGRDSALRSAQFARDVLTNIDFAQGKVELVCEAISEHDQRDISPHSLEGKILKDADFLAGVGAWGILRSALWTGENNQGVDRFFERLKVKMTDRIEDLEFPESRRLAMKEYLFVEYFLSLLEKEPILPVEQLPGKYLVLEGISGAGKETQAERLLSRLRAKGKEACKVVEPTERLKPALHAWRERFYERQVDGRPGELFLFAGDRFCLMSTDVRPALRAGKIVVSVRSFLSSMVYQSTEEADIPYALFLHRFVPTPDLIILLDIPAQVAWQRVNRRSRETGKKISIYEDPTKLDQHRQKYKDILRDHFPQGRVIDGAKSVEEVERQIAQRLIEVGIM